MNRTLLALLALFVPVLASAASVTINWSAPTQAVDGSALTGQQAITSYQIFLATAPIADTSTASPFATLTATATTTTQTIAVSPGGTIYARVKACNAAGCSDFSAQVSKLIPVSVPNPPTNVTVTLNIGP